MKKILLVFFLFLLFASAFAGDLIFDKNAEADKTVKSDSDAETGGEKIKNLIDLFSNMTDEEVDRFVRAVSTTRNETNESEATVPENQRKVRKKPLFRISLYTQIMRKFSFPIGAGMDFSYIRSKTFHSYFYVRYEYFLSPLGSKSGLLAQMEMCAEPGIGVAFTPLRESDFRILFSIEAGYYMQFLVYNGFNSYLTLSYNGAVIRPMLSVETFSLFRRYMEFGCFYQFTFLNEYRDYNSLGVFVKF